MTKEEHKRYLIDSIVEMEIFCNKLLLKIESHGINEVAYNAFYGIYLRKQAKIVEFKELLKHTYNYSI